ncbi:DUF6962 family protein [Caldimonas sp. KR1-144]|uniref:DUF6962 family protein n=1 Tax=Caldimonas sp. KR1-144 TaxID=3400911 RepID=UPI003C0F5D78
MSGGFVRPTLVCMNESSPVIDGRAKPAQQMSRLAAKVMMGATLLAGTAGLLAHGAVPLAADAHRQADALGQSGAANVWSHLPLLAAAVFGSAACARRRHLGALMGAWALFFSLVAMAAVAGASYHAQPDDRRFMFVHALIGSASCVLSLIFVAERLGPMAARTAPLAIAALAGPAAWTLGAGVDDLRWMLALQCLPVVLMPLVVWGLPSRGLAGRQWLVALGLYALAECAGVADAAIWHATAGWFGGMALSHVMLGACIGWLAHAAARSTQPADQPVAEAIAPLSVSASAECSSRSTSATTAG